RPGGLFLFIAQAGALAEAWEIDPKCIRPGRPALYFAQNPWAFKPPGRNYSNSRNGRWGRYSVAEVTQTRHRNGVLRLWQAAVAKGKWAMGKAGVTEVTQTRHRN